MKSNEKAQTSSAEKKNSVKAWIAISLSFLVLIAGISVYITGRPSSSSNTKTETYTDLGFDTPITFQAQASDEEFETYASLLRSLYLGYNAQFDQYNFYEGINNVATLNAEAASTPVEVEDCLVDLLQLSIQYGDLNDKLDITEGKVLQLWHDARESETPYVPSDQEIQDALEHTGTEGIEISGNTISFADDSIQLDLGAVAKGYTTQIVKEQLEAAGLEHGYINAGGNVVLIGEKPDGSDWVIGIQDPEETGSVVQFTTSVPLAIVTSGDYQRYMEVDGVRYSHIIDPDTGYPASSLRSVSVIDEDSAKADAMSTALFCMSVDEGLEFAQEQMLSCIWIVDKETDTAAASPALTTDRYNIYVTDSIKDQVQLSSK